MEFTNVGARTRARSFPGFPDAQVERHRLPPRGALSFRLEPGDLLSVTGGPVALIVRDGQGREAAPALGLTADQPLSALPADTGPVAGWARARGLDPDTLRAALLPAEAPLVFKSATPLHIWALLPAADPVAGVPTGDARLEISRASAGPHLPDPLGPVLEEFTVPRGTARAYPLAKGQYLQIIDVEGQQCSDFTAFSARALAEGQASMIDATATRSMVRRAYPGPGLFDKFYDRDMGPMLQVIQDTCGRHDTFGLACTARGYEERGFPGHVNCSDNISMALAPHGIAARPAWPAINFFWNTWVDPQTHHLLTEESHSRPGDYVLMRALEDLVAVSTACPDDIDPINGWNPTDVHVRIYAPALQAPRAIAHRVKEDAAMKLSRESAFHPRTSALTRDFAPARDLWLPQSYPATGTLGEYWACRERVTLQDMSALRKYDIAGPDAETLLQQLLTRDLSRLAQWRGTYGLICDDTGAVVDDGTLFRLAPHLFRWCCGSEESARRIEALAEAQGLQARLTDMSEALVNLALQGPKSRDVLAEITFTQPHVPGLEQMKWFGVTIARLNDREGLPFMLSRSGYTGELGYELFCARDDALALWDALMVAGAAHGISPMGGAALETIRIEAGLAAAGAEFGPGIDAHEAGLGFAVDLRKPAFTGRAALERNARDPRRLLKGLLFEGDDVPLAGASVFAGERPVGHVTSATRSPSLGRGIAMARLAVEHAEPGATLEVGMMDGHMKRLPATLCEVPFIDPKRERARA
ncbi:MAG: aminomethyltransferase family protein [Silicimonas sp.]|nr:aminomethyltransferase family protein [Silicimonas sp.]